MWLLTDRVAFCLFVPYLMYEWTERYSLQPWQSLFPCKAHIFITSLKWRKWTKYKQVRWEDSKGGLLLNPKPEEEIAPGADLAGGCVCVSLHGHCKSVFSLSLAFCSKMGQDTGAGCLSRNWETTTSDRPYTSYKLKVSTGKLLTTTVSQAPT